MTDRATAQDDKGEVFNHWPRASKLGPLIAHLSYEVLQVFGDLLSPGFNGQLTNQS